ncbi:hypothetical protein [Luteolibacter luteus]|uniref:PEP-CTERM sorting domain-containing protein n=1 Tax=Luteolibacter luteus TaxID=2728835 RepID=A0A858RJB3_9BACT|nr:hypothetical protein [Luteolibacter luteus]QJE96932.1 hypothetical protein HHL09_14430 [Luteolibacter luteus]
MNGFLSPNLTGMLVRLLGIGSFLAAAGLAHGAVVYSGIRNEVIPANDTGIFVNPLSGIVTTVVPADPDTGAWVNLFFGGTAIGTTISIEPAILSLATGNGDGLVRRLYEADLIGTGLSYASGMNGSENHTGSAVGQFQANIPGYLGFRITMESGDIRYGWLRITVNDLGAGTLHDWAFEDVNGTPIVVPEPGLSLLFILAFAPPIFRRSRKSS